MKDKINLLFSPSKYEYFINRALDFNLILIFNECFLFIDIDI